MLIGSRRIADSSYCSLSTGQVNLTHAKQQFRPFFYYLFKGGNKKRVN